MFAFKGVSFSWRGCCVSCVGVQLTAAWGGHPFVGGHHSRGCYLVSLLRKGGEGRVGEQLAQRRMNAIVPDQFSRGSACQTPPVVRFVSVVMVLRRGVAAHGCKVTLMVLSNLKCDLFNACCVLSAYVLTF